MSSIYFDPSDEETTIPYDSEFMEIYKIFREVDSDDTDVDSKWVLRLEFDRRESL